MNNQIYYEDTMEGQEIPLLEKEINTINMVMYLASVWFFDRIHYDYPFATQRRGLPNVISPGPMAIDYYCQLLSGWAGEKGELRKLSIQHRNFRVPGDAVKCGGKIIGKHISEGKGYVQIELWMNNQKGINCAPGKGVVELPMRESEKT